MLLKQEEIEEGFRILGLINESDRQKILIQNKISNQLEIAKKPYTYEEKISSSKW